MLRSIELAALPSTLQLCLQSADRCAGLVLTNSGEAYIPRRFHVRELDSMHAAADVGTLAKLGLVAPVGASFCAVRVTDDGIELLNTGRIEREATR